MRRASSIGVRPWASGTPGPSSIGEVTSTPWRASSAHPLALVVRHRPGQQPADEDGRAGQQVGQQPPPRPAVAGAQAVLEQQLEEVVVGAEHAVVQRLPVVGVGAGLEQQAGDGDGVLVRRLIAFAAAQGTGERGERCRQAAEEPAVVRVGAGLEQGPDRAQPVGARGPHPAVGRVHQGRPAEDAGGSLRVGAGGEQPAQGGVVGAGRRDGQVGDGQVGDGRSATAGGGVAGVRRLPPASPRRRRRRRRSGRRPGRTGRPASRRPTRRPAPAAGGDGLDVPAQAGPAREAVVAGQGELGPVEREGVVGRGQAGPAEGLRVTGADGALQLARLRAQLVEVGVLGEGGRHGELLSCPVVRVTGERRR